MQHLPIALALLFVSALVAPLLYKAFRKRVGWVLSAFPLWMFLLLLSALSGLTPEWNLLFTSQWELLPGISPALRLDGLGLVFGLLISGIGVLVLWYAAFYMSKYKRQGAFYGFLMAFMAAMLGLVLADNLIFLFVFWELTSVMSFLLIGFDHDQEKSRQAALQSLLITGFGGLCLLFALILIGQAAGTYQLSEMVNQGLHLGEYAHYPLIFILLLMAVLTKSAQFPFHFWLPGAMQAPTPVSAFLHSATMVNAGIFLLLRVHPLLGGTVLWHYLLMLAGVSTMFLGAFFSMGQRDLKRILAFTTISALGTMVLLVGIDTPLSMKAALVFFIVHGLYKGALFMVAGIIDKATGSRDIYRVGRLFKSLPLTALAAVLALVSMAGLPPMLGFIGKELIYEAKLQLPGLSWLLLPLGIGANMLMVAISLTLMYELFFPIKKKEKVKPLHIEKEFPWSFIAGPVVLSLAGLLLGMNPAWLDLPVANALYAAKNELFDIHLSLWHGFNKVLLLSAITIAAGVVLFVYHRPVNLFFTKANEWFNQYHLPTRFKGMINRYLELAGRSTGRIQHGYHRLYLITFFLITGLLVVAQLINSTSFNPIALGGFSPLKAHIVLLLVVSSLALLFAVFTPSRLSAILAMGVVGFGVGLLYLFYGAIDLAITQFLVETLVMVLFVMVIYYLPRFAHLSSRRTRVRDMLISLSVGVLVTLVVLHARFTNFFPPISDFFAENSYVKGHGRNIVNVILVDFRAMDTLGEIVVLTLAAVGVKSLFQFKIKELKTKKREP